MRNEHESIDYASEQALFGRIIFEALTLAGEMTISKIDYNHIILKFKKNKENKEITLKLIYFFQDAPVKIHLTEVIAPDFKTKGNDLLEISAIIDEDFTKKTQLSSYAYTHFDEIIANISKVLDEPLEDTVHDFLVQIGNLEKDKVSFHEPTLLNAKIVKAMESIEDVNEFFVYVQYLWKKNIGSLFGYQSDRIENIWKHKALWLKEYKKN